MALQFAIEGCPSLHITAIKIECLQWNHIIREGNKLANCFAKKGFEIREKFRVFSSLPEFVVHIYGFNAVRS
ncbi:hypothetical protein SESBI_44174 [Sesbania bispinosa]|nr:hypothetical protein SESBI_44174 [Sesbania bispinosa]